MLEKFKFWKHEEPGTLEPYPQDQGMPMNQPLPPLPQMPSEPSPFQQMAQLSPQTNRDAELITAKLDVLKAQLDNIMQRLDHLERSLEAPKTKW
ncbi:MAG: hypothetical protein AABY01_03370 [Nanoarchaeota archaeon]